MNTKSNKVIQCALIILFLHIFFASVMLSAQTSNPVGAIPGVIDVSPMGAATYTIPIEVVPGTQGMQSNLSIVYNSFGGMGLLGMKWNLAGLSAITRCGQSQYYDQLGRTSIQFNGKDRFALDGEHLLLLNPREVYGADGAEYVTEGENFIRIVSNGGGQTGPPSNFKVYTDNGSIIEYGSSSNSQQIVATNKVLSWLISKITDANGNYMTFEYEKSGNEIYIKQIRYTGNGFQPYAKVEFDYRNLPATMGKNTYFVGGYSIPQTKLLDTITVYYDNTTVRKYMFIYNIDDERERTAHLKEIVLYSGNGTEHLNSTLVEWGVQNNNIEMPQINGLPLGEGSIRAGDFNGDGYTDVILFGAGSNQDTWKLYLYNPVSNSFVFNTQGTHQKTYPPNQSTEHSFGYSYSMSNDKHGFLIAEKVIGQNVWYFRNIWFNPYFEQTIGYICDFKGVFFGNFLGYGTNMLFLRSSDNKNYELTTNDMSTVIQFSTPKKGDPYKVLVVDIDGNGKDNIQIVVDCATYTYEYNELIRQDGFPTIYHHVYYGDFNGDGIQDALVYTNEKKWLLHVGTGNGGFMHPEPPQIISQLDATPLNSTSRPPPKHPIIIADVNGDGKDEIIQGVYLGNSVTRLDFYQLYDFLSNGRCSVTRTNQVTLNEDYSTISKYNVGEFNNDGRVDILMRSSIYDKPRVVYVNKNEQYEFPKQITDGMGKQFKLTYNPGYYFAENLSYFEPTPYRYYKKYFLPIIKSLQVFDDIGNNLNTLNFFFSNPAFSYRRNIFLGFRTFGQTDIQKQESNTLYQKIDDSNHIQYGIIFGNREILVPTRHDYSLVNGGAIYSQTLYSTQLKTISSYPYRYVSYFDTITVKNILSDIKTITQTTINTVGRDSITSTKTYNTCSAPANNWMHSETKTYTYNTITLNGKQKKTVPTQILTTQQYGSNGTVIADTLTYGYYSASEKGRLAWMRRGNAHGVIKTSYGNYSVTGVYREKTVSTGNDSRKEIYDYDPTRRFVMQTKSFDFPDLITYFNYDPKTGNKTSETDVNELKTMYQYDSFGNLTQINYPDNTQTTISVKWHTASNPPNAKYYTTTTSSGKPELKIYYDILGREVCRLEDGYYFQTVYNNKGQVLKTSGPFQTFNEPDIIWHEYTYDNFGRKLTEKEAPYIDLSYTYTNREIKVTDNLRKVSSFKNYDALGRITQAKDEGGTISYSYDVTANKQYRTIISLNNLSGTTTILSDLWGNRLSITDPDAGKITSTYNKFNELTKQTDARGNTTTYKYDELGRITQKKFTASEGTSLPVEEEELQRSSSQTLAINYIYDNYTLSNRGRGKLFQIKINNEVAETIIYDDKSRLKEHTKVIDGDSYMQKHTYNANGQLNSLLFYPDGFGVNYIYNSQTGKLEEIRRYNNNDLIYKVVSRNKYNVPTRCEYGNGVATDYTYNLYGLLTRINTGNKTAGFTTDPGNDRGSEVSNPGLVAYTVDSTILNYRYTYDNKGLMISRSESVINRLEKFTYDNLDRLAGSKSGLIGQIGTPQTIYYQHNGNISGIDDVGAYVYQSNRPHAVVEINPDYQSPIPTNPCAVEYNFFNQPTKITEADYRLELFYGANQQRNKTVKYKNNIVENTHYYINKFYEKEIGATTGTKEYYYIYGDNGIVAMRILAPSSNKIYYIHTDHLGSYCAITDADKQVVQSNRFDSWGNNIGTTNFTLTARGFTGHEHYPEFKIINMNGRLYDPVIARFFSPDKYVANSSFTQDFNRYSYARNNPLMYTDPSGEWLWAIPIIVGAAWGAIQGAVAVSHTDLTAGQKAGVILGGAAIGAFSGAFGAGIGAGVTSSLGSLAVANLIGGAAGGLFSGVINSFGMTTLLTGGGNAWKSMWQGGLMGAGMGAAFGAVSDVHNALTQRAVVFSAAKDAGIDPKRPIPEFLRTKEFVEWHIKGRFHLAKRPDNIFIENGGPNLTDKKTGMVHAGAVRAHATPNDIYTGGSDMYLHYEKAFTSMNKFIHTLGHELFHVSQYAALAGTKVNYSESFTNMLEHYAHNFSNSLILGHYNTDYIGNFSIEFPDIYNSVNNFWWTSYVYRPLFKFPF